MKNNTTSIHDIGIDKFFIHFWSNLQLQIYKKYYNESNVPTISFDATGGCCKRLKRYNNSVSGNIFLYEGVMALNNKTFTALSMLSEQHDNISISVWLKRWLRCNVKPPKVVISDQSLALMSGLTQAFTQFNSLESYLNVCYKLIVKKKEVEIPTCFLRNDVNHFIKLVTQWGPVKNSKYPSTKQIITRAMGLLVVCTSIEEAEPILESLFTIILSKFDGNVENLDTFTPCYTAKRYLQSMISTSVLDILNIDENSQELNSETDYINIDDDYTSDYTNTFQEWAQQIANRSRAKVESIVGMCDNAQYIPELEPIIVRTFKLFPCWSGIMRQTFGFGEKVASSSRIECNFNHIKHRVFKNDHLPVRVDTFLEQLTSYYNGDHLLIQGELNSDLCMENDRGVSGDENSYDNDDSINDYDDNAELNQEDYIDINNDSNMSDEIHSDNEKNMNDAYNHYNDEDDILFVDHRGELLNDNTDGTSFNRNYEMLDSTKQHITRSSPNEITNISSETNILHNEPHVFSHQSNITLNTPCLMCRNGDLPTGAHKCLECGKPIHLFGCSVGIPGTEEGFGEYKICLECNKKKLILAESNATEMWCKKGKRKNSQTIRTSRSYLVQQPGFELLDLNKKGNIIPVVLLKNGNGLHTRPILFPGLGKFVITNTCSIDSILSLLATSAADSPTFREYMIGTSTLNMTSNIALQMIKEKKKKEIYLNRLKLILHHFENRVKSIVSGLKTIDVIGTASCVVDKMMNELPSLIRKSRCENSQCLIPLMETTSSKLSLNVYENEFQIQREIEDYLKTYKETCSYCGNERNVSTEITTHLFIEISSLPKGKFLNYDKLINILLLRYIIIIFL